MKQGSHRGPTRRQQVYEQLRLAIENGALAAGSRWPARVPRCGAKAQQRTLLSPILGTVSESRRVDNPDATVR